MSFEKVMSFLKFSTPNDDNSSQVSYNVSGYLRTINNNKGGFFCKVFEPDLEESKGGV